jgi:hypothetical protein
MVHGQPRIQEFKELQKFKNSSRHGIVYLTTIQRAINPDSENHDSETVLHITDCIRFAL